MKGLPITVGRLYDGDLLLAGGEPLSVGGPVTASWMGVGLKRHHALSLLCIDTRKKSAPGRNAFWEI